MRTRPHRLAALGLAATLPLAGCVSAVTPPVHVVDPVDVVLVRDARHLGLLLPRDEGGFVEFGYGDWDWYALMEDAWYDAFDTVLLPTCGALAREERPEPDTEALRRRHPRWETHTLTVSHRAAERLRSRLEATFDAARADLVRNDVYGFDFVPAGGPYWLPHNCVDAVANWLRALGCAVTPLPIRLGLSVADEAPAGPDPAIGRTLHTRCE